MFDSPASSLIPSRVLLLLATVATLCGPAALAQSAVDGTAIVHLATPQNLPIDRTNITADLTPLDAAASQLSAQISAAHAAAMHFTQRTSAEGVATLLAIAPGRYVLEIRSASHVFCPAELVIAAGEITEASLRATLPSTPCASPSALATEAQSAAAPATETSISLVETDAVDSSTDTDRDTNGTATLDGATAQASIRGLPSNQTTYEVDGAPARSLFPSRIESTAAAEAPFYSRSAARPQLPRSLTRFSTGSESGAVLATITERGTPVFHGAAVLSLRSSLFDATNPFALSTHYKDGVITNTYAKPSEIVVATSLRGGGPLPRIFPSHRIFAFAAFDLTENRRDVLSSPRDAQFYALTPTQTALLGTRGVSVSATNTALNFLDSLTGTSTRTQTATSGTLRLDYQFHSNDFTLIYTGSSREAPAGRGAGTGVVARGRGSIGASDNRADNLTARWLHRWNAALTNELRFQYRHDLLFERPDSPLAGEPAISSGGLAPQVSIAAGEFFYGTPAALGRDAYPDEQRLQIADLAQWSRGRHLFSASVSVAHIDERIQATTDREGSFIYDSGITNGHFGGLVDWITDYTFNVNAYPNGGCPSINAPVHLFCFRSFTQSFGASQVRFALHEFSASAADHWRLRPNLTLAASLRYDYVLLPLPQMPNAALDAAFSAQGSTSVFPEDRNNLTPRVALAWSPQLLRGGTVSVAGGTFAGRAPAGFVRAALADTAQSSGVTHIRITPATITACPQTGAAQGFGYPCAYTDAPPAAIAATTSASIFSRRFRLPSIAEADLGLAREFAHHLFLRAAYEGAWAVQQPNTTDINIAPATTLARFILLGGNGRAGSSSGETFVVPAYTARLVPQFGPVTLLASNANATFHSLHISAQQRRADAYWQAEYVWSKAIDYGPDSGAVPRVNGQFDPFSIGYDKALADTDVPQQLRLAGGVITHIAHGPSQMRAALSKLRLSSTAFLSSGRPYSYEVFSGAHLTGGVYSINGSGGGTYLPTVGRNTLRLPLRSSVDLQASRAFRFNDRLRGEASLTAFNVGNHVNATRVNARAFLADPAALGTVTLRFQDAAAIASEGLNTLPFGTPTATAVGPGQERRLEATIRLNF